MCICTSVCIFLSNFSSFKQDSPGQLFHNNTILTFTIHTSFFFNFKHFSLLLVLHDANLTKH